MPLPAGVIETPIHPFPTPGRGNQEDQSSPEKASACWNGCTQNTCTSARSPTGCHKRISSRTCSTVASRTGSFVRDSDVKHSYEHSGSSGEAYIASFMSIAQCTAELSVLYPNNIEIIEAGVLCAWEATRGSKPFHEGRLGNSDSEAPWRSCVMFTSYNLVTDNAALLFLLPLIGSVNSAASSPGLIVGYPEAIHSAVSSPYRTLAGPVCPEPDVLSNSSSLSPHVYRSSTGWFTVTAYSGDSEPRRDRHPSFRVADDCPDEFLRSTCRE